MVTTMLVWGLGVCGCGDYGELLYDVLLCTLGVFDFEVSLVSLIVISACVS